jgi:hypothetical protein
MEFVSISRTVENAKGRIALISTLSERIQIIIRWYPIEMVNRNVEVEEMAEGQICRGHWIMMIIAHMKSTLGTGSTVTMIIIIFKIHVLTSIIPVTPSPIPIIMMHPRGITALLPVLGKCVECDQSPHGMVYRY